LIKFVLIVKLNFNLDSKLKEVLWFLIVSTLLIQFSKKSI
jgi:hypothetical protein